MKTDIEVENRIKFLEFLEVNGLSPKTDKKILEVAPDINLSLSKLLVEKYHRLYKTFVVSSKFKYDNEYKIRGVRGRVNYYGRGLSFDVPKTKLNDANLRRGLLTGVYKLPQELDFSTVLIYGNREKMYEFKASDLRKIFGEVFTEGLDCMTLKETKRFYETVMTFLNYKYYEEYQFIEETESEKNRTYLLIKNK